MLTESSKPTIEKNAMAVATVVAANMLRSEDDSNVVSWLKSAPFVAMA